MSYRLPNFNLLCNIWLCNNVPSGGGADESFVPVQKYILSRPGTEIAMNSGSGANWWLSWPPPIVLRFARDGVYSGGRQTWQGSFFEVPMGSGQYYRTFWHEVQHEGFPNEYAMVIVSQCDENGATIPPPGHTITPAITTDACGL